MKAECTIASWDNHKNINYMNRSNTFELIQVTAAVAQKDLAEPYVQPRVENKQYGCFDHNGC